MDTSRIKRFATEARKLLMQGVIQRIQSVGFDIETGVPSEIPQGMDGGAVFMGEIVSTDFYNKWMSLYENIRNRGLKVVVEEAAYTWFNRFVAIHIMSKQGFIAPALNIMDDGSRVPFIVGEARQGRYPVMSEESLQKLGELMDDDSKTAEQFSILIVTFCHSCPIINKCFGQISDYTELLLPQNILATDGFIEMINNTDYISEEDYSSAELIGWLYQFYISDRKDEVFAKKGRYEPDEIAPATQIFTPNWIVKYMVENTIGRIYIDNNPSNNIKEGLRYLVDDVSSESPRYNELTDMKVADLACGSGHILNECFDLLFKLYLEEGYSRRQAVISIFQNNLTGVDLDTRAKQLSMFSLMMKACQKDDTFLSADVMPRIYDMPRPLKENLPKEWIEKGEDGFLNHIIPEYFMGCNNTILKEVSDAIKLMDDAQSLGSIMIFNISESTRNALLVRTREYEKLIAEGEVVGEGIKVIIQYVNIILALTEKYSAICMNPPYMGNGHFDDELSKYVAVHYERSKADLFSVFMDVAINRLQEKGKYGMINMQSWMFLPSFKDLRIYLLSNFSIDSLIHLGTNTFVELSGEVVNCVSFVITNSAYLNDSTISNYYKLTGCKNGIEKERAFINREYCYKTIQSKFFMVDGCPIGYWLSDKVITIFEQKNLMSRFGKAFQGLATADNSRFTRLWFEVSLFSIGFNYGSVLEASTSGKKWFPYNNGGKGRRWYGNQMDIVNWENDGREIKSFTDNNGKLKSRPQNTSQYFKEVITWNMITLSGLYFRYYPKGFIFSNASNSFPCVDISGTIGYLNSKFTPYLLELISPGTNMSNGVLEKFPNMVIDDESFRQIVRSCIEISHQDWDSHETSWQFQTNEFIHFSNDAKGLLEESVKYYCKEWDNNFAALHENEETINSKFIKTYGLQEELTPDVPLSEITILQAGEITHIKNKNEYGGGHYVWNYDNLMKQLISYSVGCMMGRYSLDKPGLILANQGDGIDEYRKLVPDSRFEIDDDGIIPMMSSATEFTDAVTKRFKSWLAIAFSEEKLVENLNFIEESLGKPLDDYFVKDFWNDHKKMYQNKPIYWLFSSKKGAFQCLAYMHRMNPYTAEKIRTKYLLPHIEWLVAKQQEMESRSSELSSAERKGLDSLYKQIEECREYHDRLHVIADQQIAFDLDDGVTVNYAKFGDVLQKIK